MTKNAFVFPGQGSQHIAMGKEFFDSFLAAREVFQEVDEALNQNLSKIIFEGPIEELTLTQNTQPALMTTSLAVIKVMEKEAKIKLTDHCQYVAGHSLGEYSALIATGCISIRDGAILLKTRGNAMQQATEHGVGSMAAILADIEFCQEIIKLAAKDEVCDIANYNSYEQIVISGHDTAIEKAIDLVLQKQKKAIKLNVSGAFHSSLMMSAKIKMQEAFVNLEFKKPTIPLIANVTASLVEDPARIKNLLIEQVTGMVRWYESILLMKNEGVSRITEIGAGKVLSNLNKRIDKEIIASSIQKPEDLDEFMKKIQS